ncbi:MAG: hypothetical protein ACXW5W_24410, partial [Candidatus Binatia bacterium]
MGDRRRCRRRQSLGHEADHAAIAHAKARHHSSHLTPVFRRVPTGRHIYFGANRDAETCRALNSRSSKQLHSEATLGVAGMRLAIIRLSETGKAVEAMKIESIFAAVLFVGGRI